MDPSGDDPYTSDEERRALQREMEGHPKFRGLCSTCMDCETCMFLRSADKPVLQCEEFKPFKSAPCRAVPKRKNLPDREQALAMMSEPSDLKGLCKNCDIRFECKFPKPPGGVWHCEEYQ